MLRMERLHFHIDLLFSHPHYSKSVAFTTGADHDWLSRGGVVGGAGRTHRAAYKAFV